MTSSGRLVSLFKYPLFKIHQFLCENPLLVRNDYEAGNEPK